MSMTRKQVYVLWSMVLVMLIAFGLRVWLLADTNFNWDEGYSMWMSQQGVSYLFDSTARDVHPPLYYLLLKWGRVALGDGELSTRFVSVIAGLLTVVLTFRLGKSTGGMWTGVLAALLMAVSRANIHISQLARMHAWAAFFGVLGLWSALILWRNPNSRRAFIGVVVSMTGALYTFYLTLMLPLALNVAFVWVWLRKRSWRLLAVWFGAQAIAAGLVAVWVNYARSRMFGWSSDIATPPLFFSQFYATTLTLGRPTFDNAQIPYALAYLLVMLIGGAVIFVRGRERNKSRGGLPVLLAGIFMPAVVVFLLALPFHDLGRPLAARYMLPLSATFYVLAGWSVAALYHWRRPLGVVGALVMLTSAGWGLANIDDGAIRRDELHTLGRIINDYRHPNDDVMINNDHRWTTLATHYNDLIFRTPQAEPMTEGYAGYLMDTVYSDYADGGFWLVETPDIIWNDPDRILSAWLAERSQRTRYWDVNGYRLWQFSFADERTATFDALAPNVTAPRGYAAPNMGLVGVWSPLRRVQIGEQWTVALYWQQTPDTPPVLTFTHANGQAHTVTLDVPTPADGITRQQAIVTLPADLPTGRWQVTLTVGDTATSLGQIALVNTVPPDYDSASR